MAPMMENWAWGLTIASIIGVILNIRQKKICFFIWAGTNIGWVIVDFVAGLYSQAFLFLIYLILSIWGIFSWRKLGKK